MAASEHEARMARPPMAAGALFFDTDGRVLMMQPTYKDHWDIPGGYVEVREELSTTPPPVRLPAVGWAPNDAEGDKVLYLLSGQRSLRSL